MPVLAKSEIQKYLGRGEIFLPHSWDESRLRSAAYDLRVAPDYLIDPNGTRFWPDEPDGETERPSPFTLKPGQVAFVSSIERLAMPFHLAGNIAQKFGVTRKGILVLGGLLVDPGYGLELGEDDNWRVRETGQRLHFQLANVGDEVYTVVPGETSIAGIQFLALQGSVMSAGESASDVSVPSSDDLLHDFFVLGDGRPLAPLAFFPRMADLRGDLDKTRRKVARQQNKLDSTKLSTDQLVVFGVILLTVTLFSVACAALIEGIAKGSTTEAAKAIGSADTQAPLSHSGLIIAVIVAAVVILFAMISILSVLYARALPPKRREEKRK